MRKHCPSFIMLCLTVGTATPAMADTANSNNDSGQSNHPESQVQEALKLEAEANANPLAISTYRPNYILPFDYDKHLPNLADYEASGNHSPQHTEVKYQISLKVALAQNLFHHNGDLYLGYTQFSLWQAYNAKDSAPFRETNYEPELFLRFSNHQHYWGWINTINRVGFLHQSNGRGGNIDDDADTASRSWNRIYAEAILQKGHWSLSLMPWWRIPDSKKSDNNPNIERYLGYGKVGLLYTTDNDQEFSVSSMGNPFTGRLGTEVDYTFPLWGRVRGMIQYYNGYGESLIDYDHRVNRLGVGFSFNPYLPGASEIESDSPANKNAQLEPKGNAVFTRRSGLKSHRVVIHDASIIDNLPKQEPQSDDTAHQQEVASSTRHNARIDSSSGHHQHSALTSADQADQDIQHINPESKQHGTTHFTDIERQRAAREYFERQANTNPLSLSTYRRNYILPIAYNTKGLNEADFQQIAPDSSPDHNEIKFQISIKARLWHNLYHNNGDLYVAYTQRSWWQAYNSEASSPFRETNYEPELFAQFTNNKNIWGWTNISNAFGFVHESNGRSDPISRSWNRLFFESVFARGNFQLDFRPWWRIPESKSSDDNPSIEDYMGYGRITLAYTHGDNEFTWSVVGNPGKGRYGNLFEYSFPLWSKIHGYLQYYNGYGESMIDYNHRVQRFGIGISFNNVNLGTP